MDNLLEKLDNKILNDKETLSVLPKNNKKNVDEYIKTIDELRIQYKKLKKQALREIKIRYRKIVKKQVPTFEQVADV